MRMKIGVPIAEGLLSEKKIVDVCIYANELALILNDGSYIEVQHQDNMEYINPN